MIRRVFKSTKMSQPIQSTSNSQSAPTTPSQNPENPPFGQQYESGIMMHHSSTPQQSAINNTIRIGPVSFQRRTVEGSRLIRENIHQVIEEIRPYVEQARTNLLNRQSSQASQNSIPEQENTVVAVPSVSGTNNQNNDHTINIEIIEPHSPDAAGAFSNTSRHSIPESYFTPPVPNNNNNAEDNAAAEAWRQVPEARAFIETLQKYIPFFLILIAKAVYDHREGILNLMVLFVTFTHSDSVLRREVGKQARRSIVSLLFVLLYIVGCIAVISYIFEDDKFYPALVFMPPYIVPVKVWSFLWMVAICDYIVKLITIAIKILITLFPVSIIPYQKRGKVYLLTESISQLYRSLIPIQPWLWFLLDSYQGAERVMGVLLSAAYMVAKGADLASRLKLVRTAFMKLIQSVSIGTAATKEQLQTAGEQCPICHDAFTLAVALQPCHHIFCETCACAWLDREPTCPLCRATVSDDPAWRDAATTYFIQLY